MTDNRKPVHILGISGSLRKESYNTRLLHVAEELLPEGMSLDIFDHPLQILSSKADHAIASLPLQHLLSFCGPLVNVVRCASLELADPLAERQRRRNPHRQMHMGFRTADAMQKRQRSLDDTSPDCPMSERLDFRRSSGKLFFVCQTMCRLISL